MKKLFILALITFILFCTACSSEQEEANTSTFETTTPISSTQLATQITYAPEDIELWYPDNNFITAGEPKRSIYTGIFGEAHDLFPFRAYEDWRDVYFRKSEVVQEMALVTLIKKYNVPKEAFEEAIRKEADQYIRKGRGFVLSGENWELPNADILYTFDNEVIDAYYRRENPVVPEPGTYRTYGSYEECKKAKP